MHEPVHEAVHEAEPVPATVPDEDHDLGDWTAPLDDTQAVDHTVPRTEPDERLRGWGALRDWTEPAAPSVPAPRVAPDESDDTPVEPVEPVEEERPRLIARTSLPTDVRLVGGPSYRPKLADTNPDGIKLPDTQPDGIPVVDGDPPDDEDDTYGDERAEDPDAGDDPHWPEKDADAPPPFGQFRSSPTPPRD